jgi:hypothetical protein
MLTSESERIRDLVRYDFRHGSNPTLVFQLNLLEEFASWRISSEDGDLESFLISRLLSGPQPITSSRGSTGRSVQRQLQELLARAHQRVLGRRSVFEDAGISARQSIVAELKSHGLLSSSIAPFSVVLLAARKSYGRSADDLVNLGRVLVRAVEGGMQTGDAFAMEVTEVLRGWTSTLSPKSGTVLDKALSMVAAQSGLIASDLISQTGANKSNVYRAIDELEAVGALVEVTGRKKVQLWLAPQLVQVTKRAVHQAPKSRD